MSAPELGALWRSIEDSGPLAPGSIRFLTTDLVLPTGAVLAGVDAQGHRHLCIPGRTEELGGKDEGSRGVTIEVRPLRDPAGRERAFVDVLCRRPDLSALFEVVAADILAEALKAPSSPFTVAHQVLDRWRELLEPDDEKCLGPSELAAILAELLLLEQLGQVGVPPLSTWRGPQKETHDFVCGGIDFEVKSTLTTTGRKVEIHGLSQLTPAPGAQLYLWWVRLRVSPGRGTSLPATVERLVSLGIERAQLLKRLKEVGYQQRDASRYASISFETIESDLYRVDDAFPRLTEASFTDGLPPQVTRVDYTLTLDAPDPKPLDETATNEVFQAAGRVR